MTAPVIANSAAPLGIVLIDPATGLPYSAAGGGVAFSAGTNSFSSGTIILSNSNGITFGMGTNGVITATVIPGAAAGIAAFQLPNTTYTSGTVNFINSNGLSFGSTTGGGVTASYTVPGATVFSNSNNVTFGLNGSTVTASATLPIGIGGAAAGSQTGTSGTLVFANSNGLTFGMSGSSQVTGSYTVPGATVFSNSNNVTFGLAGSTITATATFTGGGAAISAAGSSQNAGTIVFSNSNGVSFGMNGSTITATVTPGASAGIGAVVAGTQTQTSGTLSFANSNGLTFGLSGSSQITGSYTVPGATVFSNSNNVTFGLAGSTITASATVAQTNQSLGIYGSSQTTGQSSSSTVDARSLSVVGAGVISVGMSGGSLLISAPGTTGLTQLSAGMSTGGNTTGTTGLASAQLVLAGGSNITLSGSTNGGSMTVTVIGGAGGGGGIALSAGTNSTSTGTVVFSNSNGITFGMNTTGVVTASVAAQTLGAYAVGNTTQSSSSTFDARTLSFNGAGAMSVGFTNGSIQLSAPVTSSLSATGIVSLSVNGSTISIGALQSVQTIGVYGVSNTTQSTSSTVDARSLSFQGAGGVSVGLTNGSVVISGATGGGGGFSAGVSTGGNSSGATGITGTNLVLAGGNNITLSQTTGASGATVTISAANIATTAAYYFLGNSTGQSSSSTAGDQTLSFSLGGAVSGGWSGGSVLLSAPGTSSISVTGQLSMSVNASTISIGAPNYGTLSYWDNGILNGSVTTATLGAGSVILQGIALAAPLSFSALREFISGSFSVTNSSYGNTISVRGGLYTLNGSTLSLASSGSATYALTNTSNNSASLYSGIKGLTMPLGANLTPGNYWLGLWSSTASSGFNFATFNNVLAAEGSLTFSGLLGASAANSNQVILGAGIWSATSASMPVSIGLSDISGTIGNIVPFVNLYNITA